MKSRHVSCTAVLVTFVMTLTAQLFDIAYPIAHANHRDDPSRGGRYVGGVVTNWTLVTLHHDTQSCMDPNVIEAKVVVSSCGHDGPMGAHSVKRLASLGMVPQVLGMAALDMNAVSALVMGCDLIVKWPLQKASSYCQLQQVKINILNMYHKRVQ